MKRFLKWVFIAMLVSWAASICPVLCEGEDAVYSNTIYGESFAAVTFVSEGQRIGEVLYIRVGSPLSDLPGAPEKEGYVFEGWMAGGEKVHAGTIVRGDMTITAGYRRNAPETTLTGTADGVTVSVHAEEGTFPKGTTMEVRSDNTASLRRKADGAVSAPVTEVRGVAVHFEDADGERVEPEGTLSVSVSASLEADTLSVVSGSGTVLAASAGNTASFETKSLSLLAVVGSVSEDSVPRRTYAFYLGDNLLSTQIIRDGGRLTDPGIPELPGNQRFEGWVTGDIPVRFSEAISVTETETVRVDAKVTTIYTATFLNEAGQVLTTRSVTDTDPVLDLSTINLVPASDRAAFRGWALSASATETLSEITLTENVTLYPVLAEGCWLRFDGGENASYTAPVLVETGKAAAKPADPVRTGYVFQGWALDTAGAEPYDWDSTVNSDMLLYACWQPGETKLTIARWVQKVTDDKNAASKSYDYLDSTTVIVASSQAVTEQLYASCTSLEDPGYVFSSVTAPEKAAADGTSVIHLFFDRRPMTIVFHRGTESEGMVALPDDDYTTTPQYAEDGTALRERTGSGGRKVYLLNGKPYTGTRYGKKSTITWSEALTMTGLYGQTLSSCGYTWPDDVAWYTEGDETGSHGNRIHFKDTFDGSIQELHLYEEIGPGSTVHITPHTVSHYRQKLDGSYPDTPENTSIVYGVGPIWLFQDKYEGFEVTAYQLQGDIQRPIEQGAEITLFEDMSVFYRRKTYPLLFMAYGQEFRRLDILYEGAMLLPEEVPEARKGEVFAGWYEDETGTKAFEPGSPMPRAAKVVYARFDSEQHTVTLDARGGTLTGALSTGSITVPDGTVLSHDLLTQNVQREGYAFVGWFTEQDGTLIPYAYGKVESDLTLTAVWRDARTVRVRYDAGEHGSNAPSDDHVYLADATIPIAGAPQAEDGYVFRGWSAADITCAPGSSLRLSTLPASAFTASASGEPNAAELTLVAAYGQSGICLTYDANGGSGGRKTFEKLAENSTVTLKSPEELSFSRDNHVFLGWAGSPEAVKPDFAAGDSVLIDGDGENVLYAVWAPEVQILLNTQAVKCLYSGTEQESGYTAEVRIGGESCPLTALPAEISIAVNGISLRDAWPDIKASGTDAGRYEQKIRVSVTSSSEQYAVKTASLEKTMELLIEPLPVKVKIIGNREIRTYNWKEQSVSGYTPIIDDGEAHLYQDTDIVYEGSPIASGIGAGTYPMNLDVRKFKNRNRSFVVSFEIIADGQLQIEKLETPVTVSVRGSRRKVSYNREPQSVQGFTFSSSLSAYTQADFTLDGNASVSGTVPGAYPMGLTASRFRNTNANVSSVRFEVEDGLLEVDAVTEPVHVQITGHCEAAVYSGETHTVEGYEIHTDNPLYKPEDIRFTGTDSVSEIRAGTWSMGLMKEQFGNGNPGFASVLFEVKDGKLEIAKAPVTVEIQGNTAQYSFDGQPHRAQGYRITKISDSRYDSGSVKLQEGYTAEAEGTEVGKAFMGLSAASFDNTDANWKVRFEVMDGFAEILKRKVEVTIRGHRASVPYDKKPHAVQGYEILSEPLYPREAVACKAEAKAEGTVPDTYAMHLRAEDFGNTDDRFDVTFAVEDGALTITRPEVKVTVTGHTLETVYDGKPHEVSGFEITAEPASYTLEDMLYSGEGTALYGLEAGIQTLELREESFANANECYGPVKFTVAGNIVLNIRKAPVTVKVSGKTLCVPYNGKEQSVSGITVQEISLETYQEEYFVVTDDAASAKRTHAGITPMELDPGKFRNLNSNYEVTFELVKNGFLEILPAEITVRIAGSHYSGEYDGAVHTVKGFAVLPDNALYNPGSVAFTAPEVPSASRQDVGRSTMGLRPEQFLNRDDDFKVTFHVEDGYAEVIPAKTEVIISGRQAQENYDGKDHTVSGYDFNASNELYGAEDFTYTGTAQVKRKDAGTASVILQESLFVNQNPNFEVKFRTAVNTVSLTILPVSARVRITGHTGVWTYDGERHEMSGYDAEALDPLYNVADLVYEGTAEAALIRAGQQNMGLDREHFVNRNSNFSTVEVTVTDGYVRIEPRPVEVRISGENKVVVYNGSLQKAETISVECGDALYDTASLIYTGESRAEGRDAGRYAMGLKPEHFRNTDSCFAPEIFLSDGSLTIQQAPVTVEIKGKEETIPYDTKEHVLSGYDVTGISNALYTSRDFHTTEEKTSRGTLAGTYPLGWEEALFVNDNPNFTVRFNVKDGVLNIAKRPVTVRIHGRKGSHVYDRKAHETSGYDLEISDTLYTEQDIAFEGQAAAERTETGTTFMGLTAEAFSNRNENFQARFVIAEDGSQTINPASAVVSISGNTLTCNYDGRTHRAEGFTAAIDNPAYLPSDFVFKGTAEASGKDAGTVQMTIKAEDFQNRNNNFASVVFQVEQGGVTILPVPVTVKIRGEQKTVTFDGQEHAVSGFVVETDNALYTEADLTFIGKAEAKATHAGTVKMGLSAAQFANRNGNFRDVAVEVEDGFVTVSPRALSILVVGRRESRNYNGEEQKLTGYDVVADVETYDRQKLQHTGTAEARGTHAGSYPMGLAAEEFENTDKDYQAKVTVVDGQLAISPLAVQVKIRGMQKTAPYNGAEQRVSGYSVEISEALYTEQDFRFTGEKAEAGTKDVGTVNMGLSASLFVNGNLDFVPQFQVEDGFIRIEPRNIKVLVKGSRETVTYDRKVHTVRGYAIETDPLYTEGDMTFTGTAEASGTNAGSYAMPLKASDFANKNKNFLVTFEIGEQGILLIQKARATVRITGRKVELPYDGEAHTVSGYETVIDNPSYLPEDFHFEGNAEVSGTDAGQYAMPLLPENFVNDNGNFEPVQFEVTSGSLNILPLRVNVTIRGAAETVTYDGKPHKVQGYRFNSDQILFREEYVAFTGKAEAVRTAAGRTEMPLTTEQFSCRNRNFVPVFNVSGGSLTVEKRPVTVTIRGESREIVYNGEMQQASGFTASCKDSLYDPAKIVCTGNCAVSALHQGSYEMVLREEDFTNTDDNFAATLVLENGRLTIRSAPVTVTIRGNRTEAVYDGKIHTTEGYTVEKISSALYQEKDFALKKTAKAERTDAGQTPLGLAAEDFENRNPDFATAFEVTDGYVLVRALPVTVAISGHAESSVYDGKEHRAAGYDAAFSSPLYTSGDMDFRGTAEAVRTVAGTTPMGLSADQFENRNGNFAVQFLLEKDGSQTIEKAEVEVTVKGRSIAADYDAQEHVAKGYEVTFSNPLYGEKDFRFTGIAEARRTHAGMTAMSLSAEQFTNLNDNFEAKYTVTPGTVEIRPVDAVVKIAGTQSRVAYDGRTHTAKGYEVVELSRLYSEEDFAFSGTASAERRTAGKSFMGLTAEQFTNRNRDFRQVRFEITDGFVEVARAKVDILIIGKREEVPYNGEVQRIEGIDIVCDDLYPRESLQVEGTTAAEGKDAGNYPMGLAADQFRNTNENFETTIRIVEGMLVIQPAPVTVEIRGQAVEAVYDGKEHEAKGYTTGKISNPLYREADFILNQPAEATRTNAGTTEMGLKPESFENRNANFAPVTFQVRDGYVKVDRKPVQVEITGRTASLVYTGEEQSVQGFAFRADTALYTDKDFAFTGNAEAKRTDAGYTEMTLSPEQFTNRNDNYGPVRFATVSGGLEIKPAEVSVTVTGVRKEAGYDGKQHIAEGFTLTLDSPFLKAEDVIFTGKASAGGVDPDTYPMGLTESQFSVKNPNLLVRFSITDGQMQIHPGTVKVKIRGRQVRVPYSGILQRAEGYEMISADNPAYRREDFRYTGEPRAERKDAGYTGMGLNAELFRNENAFFEKVTFEVEDGGIEVLPLPVTVRAAGKKESVPYDGKEHTLEGFEIIRVSSSLYSVEALSCRDTTISRTDAGTTAMGLKPEDFANADENFQITVVVEDGALTVLPMPVTVEVCGRQASSVYDARQHSVEGYTVKADNALYLEEYMVFTGEAKAASTDVGKAVMGLKESAFANRNPNFGPVTFVVQDGWQEITPASVQITVTGRSEKAVYDGKVHTASGYTVAADPLCRENQIRFTGEAEASRKDAGKTNMGLRPEQFSYQPDPNLRVSFTVLDGAVEVVPAGVEVHIRGSSGSEVYDTREHRIAGFTAECESPLFDAGTLVLEGKAEAEGTLPGTYAMGLSADRFTCTDQNLVPVFLVEDGRLVIKKATAVVHIRGARTEAVYDAEMHEAKGYTVVCEPSFYNEADFEFTGKAETARKQPGTSFMNLQKSQFTNRNDCFDSVQFQVEDGAVTILPAQATVQIRGSRTECVYDGAKHESVGYAVVKISNPLYRETDFVFEGSAGAARTENGWTAMGLTPEMFRNSNP